MNTSFSPSFKFLLLLHVPAFIFPLLLSVELWMWFVEAQSVENLPQPKCPQAPPVPCLSSVVWVPPCPEKHSALAGQPQTSPPRIPCSSLPHTHTQARTYTNTITPPHIDNCTTATTNTFVFCFLI